MMKTLQRGFTLIELLVVIAIIGILAAVVLASLNDARDGGQDASIKQSMGNIRSQAELFYNQNNYTYEGVCADANIVSLLEAAASNRSETTNVVTPADATASTDTTVQCHDGDGGYAAIAPLNIPDPGAAGVQSWCIDSTGFVGTSTAAGVAITLDDDSAEVPECGT